MHKTKKISVIIPVYSAEKYIAATIQSALAQTYDNFELLIVDDGSPDKSIEICQQFTDSRIKIIRQVNRGVAAARNNGIRHAQGEYITFLDADDLWLPEKLEKHANHLNSSLQVGVSFSYSAFIDEQGNPIGVYNATEYKVITPGVILCRNPLGSGSNMVIRRKVLEAIRFHDNLYGTVEDFYFDEDRQLHPTEDLEFWFRISVQTDWHYAGIAEPLTLYRLNSEGHSANLRKKVESLKFCLEKARCYAPEIVAEWEKPAMAYGLRYLARRAVTIKAGSAAVELSHQAIATHWRLLLEEPRRTLVTLTAAYLLRYLPESLYDRIKVVGLKIIGASQRRRILRSQSQSPQTVTESF